MQKKFPATCFPKSPTRTSRTLTKGVMSEFQCHLLNSEDKGMMEKVLFQ
jgi:hypothetical protein